MSTLPTRLRGLAAAAAVLAFVVGVPALLLAIDATPDPGAFSWPRLTAPDDGTLALEVITAVCWAAWAVFTCQLLASIVFQLRGMRAPRLPGLAVPQLAANQLVATAALLFVAVPAVAAFLPQPRAQASATAAPLPEPRLTVDLDQVAATAGHTAAAADVAEATTPKETGTTVERTTERYTVKRGDSLWKIAEQRLGDGTRYVELVDLNRGVLDGRPDFLRPGTVLHVPVPDGSADDAAQGAYVVQPGDTLSEIAKDQLGHADAYPSIFHASRDTAQANGAHLTDPDMIRPGWKLTIPASGDHETPAPPKHAAPSERSPEPAPLAEDPPPAPADEGRPGRPEDPAADSSGESAGDSAGRSAGERAETSQPQDTTPDDETTPVWLLPGLTGAGAVLGAAFWLVLRAQRRTQLRYRRPGTIMAPPPPELAPGEKSARRAASVIAPRIEDLDMALRSLAPMPRLLSVELSEEHIELALAQATELPAPWTGSDTCWRIALADVPARTDDVFPPYPLLVSIGRADTGAFVFLNLEELRTVTVTGDEAQKSAFARHLAAELAVNPWSIVATVDLLGLGPDLAAFNLGRVRTHPAGDTDFIAGLAHDLGALEVPYEPDDFNAAIIATANRPEPDMTALRTAIERVPGRSSAALVELAGEPRPGSTHFHLTTEGRLQVASLGIDITAAGLSEDEARACALLLDLTIEERAVPVPPSEDPDAVSDLAGALASPLTEERPTGAAGDTSLLPLAPQVYVDAAATTPEDVQVLAPCATPDARARVEAADPDLDEDLARWDSPTVTSAKLTLLGPVGARTTGDAKATAHRRPFYVELLAYLVLHPTGAPGTDIAAAFAIKPDRVRVDISHLRRWLGTNPNTGKLYLPKAETPATADTPALYKVHGVLCDLDLFRRLRTRGQSRGADGIEDLVTALRLVTGEPFTDLRKDHWAWLLDGERWDHIMTSAIVDVGHIVTTHALANADVELALWAAQTAYVAAPYDEVAQLDMIQAETATGNEERASADLDTKVFNRRDDELPPIEIPKRSAQIVGDKNWGTRIDPTRRTG
ncbi:MULTISPECIES: LysM peptidoglycan-binding domain-containing protein [unclassified Nocardioides]|uniref:LysM peptidoglycan-binding domain-containing protein n=1 Tax=unclassified Nocardioides TaxID=2615069 RepID=UPI0006FC25AC|nr:MULTISPECIES: LysM peptidoglycan-binding domain-containing protein [unclassified Nocardioides]KRA30990.1 hypothetical protein ASD81_15950 [Nocardioides sp. Root614]KRA87611.1 hypothetical protein ASD84_16225 [Nocardioides sp. Root682]